MFSVRNVFISSLRSVQFIRMASNGKKLNVVAKSEEVGRVTRSSGIKRNKSTKIEEPALAVDKAKSVKRKLVSPVDEHEKSIKEESDDDFVDTTAPKRSNKKKKVSPKSTITDEVSDEEETGKKPKKSKKAATTASTKAMAPKAELLVPEIVIPSKGEMIIRPTGPSPYNGTIQFANKVYLGAHISAAGD